MLPDCLPFMCPLGAGVRLFEDSGPAGTFAVVLWSCVPSFLSSLSLCAWCIGFEYGSISRFKAVFSAFYGVCVGSLGLVLCVACVAFCARVELGGLEACGVFASVFLSFPLYLPYVFPLFVLWLSSFTLVVFCCSLSWFVLCFLFPLRYMRKKKGHKGFAPCVLSSCVVVC